MTLRTAVGEAKYAIAKKSGKLKDIDQEKHLREWRHWSLVVNRFPYGKLVEEHHMLVLKRRCAIWDITPEELSEFWYEIGPWIDERYHNVGINTMRTRSVNGIPHIHLVTYQKRFVTVSALTKLLTLASTWLRMKP